MSVIRTATLNEYIPGVANIGRAECQQRQQLGSVALAATAVLVGVLLIVGAPAVWRLSAVVPASAAALGFLQAALRFSARHALAGVHNFSSNLGRTEKVGQSVYREADRHRAVQLLAYAVTIGAGTAVGAFLLPV